MHVAWRTDPAVMRHHPQPSVTMLACIDSEKQQK
jgi:serine protease inhibitor ecotin